MDLIIKAFHKIKNENYTLMPNKESESSYYVSQPDLMFLNIRKMEESFFNENTYF